MNYWYSAQANEIFLDLDSNRAIARALSVLRVALRKRDLSVESVWLYSTSTPHHAHMIIVLKKPMAVLTKMAWSLWLGNDRLRVAYVIERLQRNVIDPDLLVARREYHRPCDSACTCKDKHKPAKVTRQCIAMRNLLGDERNADYFTRTGKAPTRKKFRVPWGRVSLKRIRHWSNE